MGVGLTGAPGRPGEWRPAKGQDTRIEWVDDDGKAHRLTVAAFKVWCSGRGEPLMALLEMPVTHLDVVAMPRQGEEFVLAAACEQKLAPLSQRGASLTCARCGGEAKKVNDVQGWDGWCVRCGLIAQHEVLEKD